MLTKIASGCALAIALRTDSGTKTSVVRVITVRNPAPCKSFCKRNAVSSATIFSGTLWPGMPPRSKPPCPGSITTVENELSARASPSDAVAKTIVTALNKLCRSRKNIRRSVKIFFLGRADLPNRISHDDRLWLIAVINAVRIGFRTRLVMHSPGHFQPLHIAHCHRWQLCLDFHRDRHGIGGATNHDQPEQ